MNSKAPQVSIGLPTYNNSKYIVKAINSLLAQTLQNFELIISDNASTDETQQICKKYAAIDKRVKYFRQKTNVGMIKNFNFVLTKSHGDYFIWASDDDFWHKSFIEKLYSLLQKNKDAVLAMSNFDNVYNSKHFHHPSTNLNIFKTKFRSLLHFLKTGELSYFYGLYKTPVLKSIDGYHFDSRPFFKSSDYLTVFKILLKGRMTFTNGVFFFKRDTGYHFDRFVILRHLELNPKVIKTILRYLCFPLFNFYNLLYSLKYILPSDFIFTQKLIIIFYIFYSFFKNNLNFLQNVFTGFFYLLTGVTRLFFERLRSAGESRSTI